MILSLQKRFLGWLQGMGRLALFMVEVLRAVVAGRALSGELIYQIYFLGLKSHWNVGVSTKFATKDGRHEVAGTKNILRCPLASR